MKKSQVAEILVNHLKRYVNSTPLEVLAHSLAVYGASQSTTKKLFDSYDTFLSGINEPDKRTHLQSLKSDEASESQVFQDLREVSHQFQGGLNDFFFERNSKLSEMIKKYGVF